MSYEEFKDIFFHTLKNSKREFDYAITSSGYRKEFIGFTYNGYLCVVIHENIYHYESGNYKLFTEFTKTLDKETFRLDTPHAVLYFNSYNEIYEYLIRMVAE